MGHDTPRQTREGRLIEAAATATGLSVKKLSANAGISDTRWRHIVKGWQPAQGGGQNPVVAPALTLARMAYAVGITAEQLAEVGRTDAAELLASNAVTPTIGTVQIFMPGSGARGPESEPDEIDMIYASTSMSAREKLERIRMVLRLRAEIEAELAAARNKASASDAEAEVEQQS